MMSTVSRLSVKVGVASQQCAPPPPLPLSPLPPSPLPPPPGIRLAAEIVDTPTNQMYTDTFIERVRGVASKLGVAAPLVIRGEELQEKGFGGQTEWVWLSC